MREIEREGGKRKGQIDQSGGLQVRKQHGMSYNMYTECDMYDYNDHSYSRCQVCIVSVQVA